MATKTIDFTATRANLRGELLAAEADYMKTGIRVGEVALEVQLGNAPQSDLDAARAAQSALASRIGEIDAALAVLEEREEDAATADADRQRESDEKRLQELAAICTVAGRKVLKLSADLAEACAEGAAAAAEAVSIGQKHDINTSLVSRWSHNASHVIHARLNASHAVPGFVYGGQPEQVDALEATLRQVVL